VADEFTVITICFWLAGDQAINLKMLFAFSGVLSQDLTQINGCSVTGCILTAFVVGGA
jgi:hypothetical protein